MIENTGNNPTEGGRQFKDEIVNDVEAQLAINPHPEVLSRILCNLIGQVELKKILTAEIRKVIDRNRSK
ncbi:hypothetical protein HY625_00610 [Candidatus Uhrbacteria bacterium]|nr:hypothetical protein [Candidatus Uhrbacteria bacterium]